MSVSLWRQKAALYGLMFLPGFSWASWVTRTPAMRDTLHASTELMGLILFGFSCGSLFGVLSAGKVTHRFGIRTVMAAGFILLLMGLPVLAAGLALQSTALAFLGLALFGAGTGWIDISINIEGAAFEQSSGQTIMTTLHGFFSFGTLCGALLGMAMTALNISTALHFSLVFVVAVLMALMMWRQFPWSQPVEDEHAQQENYLTQVKAQLRDRRLLLLGVVILAMALAEGSANDWIPLLMIDGHNFGAAAGTLIYVGFTAGMTAGRFLGGFLVALFGRVWMLRASAASAAIGLALVIFSSHAWLAAAAVLFWGMGASLGFPLTISAAGEGKNSAVRVTIAATLGYIAFLVGPPALGFIGEHAGLRMAMLPVLIMVILALCCSTSARDEQQTQNA
ncbi:MFS transporter [Pantoea sp. A4]|uniref:MFS transporter n=1 Tax=Pantoea sp. A4 TaxID=1225184 RepID=UPI00037EABC9|nr:MFS transporter [Pantoea sp. A4]